MTDAPLTVRAKISGAILMVGHVTSIVTRNGVGW